MQDTSQIHEKIQKYLNKRRFFRKRARRLLKKGEKFQKVTKIKKLSLGLNNAVYSMQIQFKKKKQIQNRDYILRVYPDNDNDFKPKKEHGRLVEIQKYDISTAEVYIFENKLDALGNRFLILEKLNGIPVQESVQDFTKEETKEFLAELARYLGTIHGKRSKNFEYSFPKDLVSCRSKSSS